jgi:transposase
MRRYKLSKEQYELIEDLLPRNGNRGGQWKNHRELLNAMFWVLYSGAQWREMPERYGSWKTVYDQCRRWSRDGTIGGMLSRLHLKLDEDGYIDMSEAFVDSTIIRASRSAAGAKKSPGREPSDHVLGMSRGGYGTKIHLACDKNGAPLSVVITGGQVHDSTQVEPVLNKIRIPRQGLGRPKARPAKVAADKAYSMPRIRRHLIARAIKSVIPRKSNQQDGRA